MVPYLSPHRPTHDAARDPLQIPRDNEAPRAAPAIANRLQQGFSRAVENRLSPTLCCALAGTHLLRGYLLSPTSPDLTALVGNALWEVSVPSRSAVAVGALHWASRTCPLMARSFVQRGEFLAHYMPMAELFWADPYLESLLLAVLIGVPVLCKQSKVDTRYSRAATLCIAGALHVGLSQVNAKQIA